jgi:Na+-translocating ferredoxin:NAD+ oxidoreductase RnfG subunit
LGANLNDFYWDLLENNKDAIVYTEYEDAYMGHTTSIHGKSVAVYHTNLVMGCIIENLKETPGYLDKLHERTEGNEEEMIGLMINDAEEYFDEQLIPEVKEMPLENAPMFVEAPTHDSRFDYEEE